jgi:hypothetical protein
MPPLIIFCLPQTEREAGGVVGIPPFPFSEGLGS